MRNRSSAALVLGAVMLAGAAHAAPPPPLAWHAGDITFKPFLSDRVRFEFVNWFDPGRNAGASGAYTDEDYNYEANVIRFGSGIEWKNLSATFEGQEVELWNLPSDAQMADKTTLGPGAVYYANTADHDPRELSLRRAVLEWSDALVKGLALSGGRYILNEGAETTATDSNLSWLKKARISQRLVGAFDYTHTGRSFDGGTLRYAKAPWNFTFSGGRPTAGGFNISANNEVEEVGIAYAALSMTEPKWLPRSDARLFYLYYEDDRGLVATDNRPLAARQASGGDITIHSIGANFEIVRTVGPGDVDGLVWVVGQTGQWETLDHEAWAIATEVGYRLTNVATKPWLRAGWYHGSGDSNANDGTHETFFQVLPTARQYAQTPFYNLMNNEDAFAQLLLSPLDALNVRAEYHHLWVSEGADLMYTGGGATMSHPLFGYSGFSSRGHTDVGNFVDLSVEYSFLSHAKIYAYYGHVFGGSVIEGEFPASHDLDYAYLELTLSL